MLNGNTVATLTFNQFNNGQKRAQDSSMFDQFYQYQQQQRDGISGASRGRMPHNSTAGSS
jgi:hypothetical protein